MASIPPGYCDAKKDGDDRYGDLLLWKQVLDHATKIGTPVILITDDKKEDWWWKVKGRTIGPRHEMRAEMLRVAGTLYYQYSTEQFMKHSGAMLDVPATEEAIEEVRLVNLNYDAGLRELEKATGLSMSAFPEIETKAAELAKAFASPDVPNFASTSATELIARWDQEHRERLQNPFGLTAQHLAPSLGLDNGPKIHDRLMQTLSALGLASSSAVETIAAWDRERTELLANTMGRTMQELAAAIGVGPAVMASKAFVQNVLSPLDETASSLRASLLGTALFESMKYSYPGSSLTRNAQGPTDATPDAEEDDGESS